MYLVIGTVCYYPLFTGTVDCFSDELFFLAEVSLFFLDEQIYVDTAATCYLPQPYLWHINNPLLRACTMFALCAATRSPWKQSTSGRVSDRLSCPFTHLVVGTAV